jgi:hypothetical protein
MLLALRNCYLKFALFNVKEIWKYLSVVFGAFAAQIATTGLSISFLPCVRMEQWHFHPTDFCAVPHLGFITLICFYTCQFLLISDVCYTWHEDTSAFMWTNVVMQTACVLCDIQSEATGCCLWGAKWGRKTNECFNIALFVTQYRKEDISCWTRFSTRNVISRCLREKCSKSSF